MEVKKIILRISDTVFHAACMGQQAIIFSSLLPIVYSVKIFFCFYISSFKAIQSFNFRVVFVPTLLLQSFFKVLLYFRKTCSFPSECLPGFAVQDVHCTMYMQPLAIILTLTVFIWIVVTHSLTYKVVFDFGL